MVDLSRRAAVLRRVRLRKIIGLIILIKRAMEGLLEDRLRLVDLELALQISHVVGDRAAVGATTSIGKAELLVCHVIPKCAPITPATAVFLDLLGVGIGVATLGEETW